MFWVSHILVRHLEAEESWAPFSMGQWDRLDTPPARSKQQALQLARSLAAKAQADPAQFGELAKSHSEDEATKDFEGRLGAMPARELVPWPQVLDALAALKAGEVSQVVETGFGFHIFLKGHPPPPEQLAGRHLVIGYERAVWLKHLHRSDRKWASRSREEAHKLARELADQARRSPAEFADLIREHSEHEDVAEGGDLGVWSNREPTHLVRELMALASLPVGGISDPLDTHLGFQVLLREKATERQRYAMSQIRLPYDPSAPDGAAEALLVVQKQAESIAGVLRRDPTQLARFQKKLCCEEAEQWSKGRGPIGVSELLDRLAPGEISKTPANLASSFVILRRLDPSTLAPPAPPLFELPSPAGPNLSHLVRVGPPAAVARFCRGLATVGKTQLALAGKQLTEFESLHASLAVRFEKTSDPNGKEALMESMFAQLHQMLGAKKYAQYRTLLDARLEGLLLKPLAGT